MRGFPYFDKEFFISKSGVFREVRKQEFNDYINNQVPEITNLQCYSFEFEKDGFLYEELDYFYEYEYVLVAICKYFHKVTYKRLFAD